MVPMWYNISMKELIAWAAGLFEGEGSIILNPARSSYGVSMSQTDKDVLEKFQSIVGGKISKTFDQRKPHYKKCWQWWAYGENAKKILLLLYPYLQSRRKERADEWLNIREEKRKKRYLNSEERGVLLNKIFSGKKS